MDDKVLVYKGSQMHAEMARGILEDNGIPSLLTSQHGGIRHSCRRTPEDYFLYVRPDHAALARDLVSLVEDDMGG